jgi:hypothetical protein
MTDNQKEKERIARAQMVDREQIRAMIGLDTLYNETVPFVDYMPFNFDDDKTYHTQPTDPINNDFDPHADIKGKRLTPYGHLDKKNTKNMTGMMKTTNNMKLDMNEKQLEYADVLRDNHLRTAYQNCTVRARRLMEKYRDKNSGLY